MHHPPAVRFSVDGSPWPRRLLLTVVALAVLQAFWFVLLNPTPTWQAAAIGASLLFALGAAWSWTQGPAYGSLQWDGMQWQWSGLAGGACALRRHLDFQTLMLVSLQCPSGPAVWLWLQRSEDPYQWLALRRAVVHTTSPDQAHRDSGTAPSHHTGPP